MNIHPFNTFTFIFTFIFIAFGNILFIKCYIYFQNRTTKPAFLPKAYYLITSQNSLAKQHWDTISQTTDT